MKNIYVACIAAFLLSMEACWAQAEFHQAVGLGLKYSFMSNDQNGYGYGAMIQYEPRLVLGKNLSETSLSLNTAIGYGLTKSKGLQTNYLEIPLAFGFNYGLGASKNSKSSFGGFLDVGYAYFTPAMSVMSNHPIKNFRRTVEERTGPLHGGYLAVGFRTKNGSSANYSQYRFYFIVSDSGLGVLGFKTTFNFAAYSSKKNSDLK